MGRNEHPTLLSAAVRRAKIAGHQAMRAARDARAPVPRGHVAPEARRGLVLAESRAPLWVGAPEELWLTAGKVENLRVAARRLDGRAFGPHEVFSFWRHVGRPTRRRGFVEGREVREGCVVPSVGGGLCQLTNALHDAALRAGFEIVERHAHSVVVPGSLAEAGRDATVLWNYLDLRFRSPHAFTLGVRLSADELVVSLHGARPAGARVVRLPVRRRPSARGSCVTCGHDECHLVAGGLAGRRPHTAFLLDGVTPEHAAYVREARTPEDRLLVPVDGARRGVARYRHPAEGFARVNEALPVWALRAALGRALAEQGAERQRALLRLDGLLAAAHAARLDRMATRLVVDQALLPHLHARGVLGGRRYDVLLTRPPLAALAQSLDAAAKAHPESPTLADFRPEAALVRAETEALEGAERVITAHAELAAAFGARSVLLPWAEPSPLPPRPPLPPGLAFVGTVVGRRGAYEAREVARRLGLPLYVDGLGLEGPDFFRGVEVRPVDDALAHGAVLLAPPWVCTAPRAVLAALARGVPVVATHAVGLSPRPGLALVARGDVDGLCAAVADALAPEAHAFRVAAGGAAPSPARSGGAPRA